jgi:opacity protein-like surface antigen
MRRAKTLSLAGAAALLSTASLAADLPPPVYRQPVPVAVVASGWYLRGYIGAGNQFLSEISHPDFATAPMFTFLDKGGFDSAPFGGGGIGFQWNNWLRVDGTLEYRGKAAFHALDRFFNPWQFSGPAFNTNQYTATKSELVALANFFFDLGTFWCFTPFIGASAGVAQIKIDHFRDVNVIAGGGGWADSATQTNFAWALSAGAAYKVTPNFAVELSYRYLNLGDAKSGTLVNLDPTVPPTTFAPVTFHKIQSHDIMLGVRWMLQPDVPLYAPPIIRKG